MIIGCSWCVVKYYFIKMYTHFLNMNFINSILLTITKSTSQNIKIIKIKIKIVFKISGPISIEMREGKIPVFVEFVSV